MRISGRLGLGNAENGLIDGSDVVSQYAQQPATFAQQLAAIPPSPVGLIPACILGYGLIQHSRTATIVGGIWAGLNFANWLGWKSRQSSAPAQTAN